MMAAAYLSAAIALSAQNDYFASPRGINAVEIVMLDGKAYYQVEHHSTTLIGRSRLGLETNYADFSELEYVGKEVETVKDTYTLNRSKASNISYEATRAVCTFKNKEGKTLKVEFHLTDKDVAFRYLIPKEGETGSLRIMNELTEFTLQDSPEHDFVKTYLTPQSDAMIGWKRTKPSYEEYYGVGKPVTAPSQYGHGYTFPCLFYAGSYENVEDAWVQISETGVDGRFCGSRLGEYYETEGSAEGQVGATYKIEYPMAEENNGNGTVEPAIALPGATPWRTITLGGLDAIVESTVTWDLVEPLYEPSYDYQFGKGTWSWILWQDNSINMDDQKKYIDLASAMGFKYNLVDNWWDTKIGHENIPELVKYAREKNVELFLWYSSSGWWNDIEQGPINIMSNPILRKKEMRWLRDNGIKGIKVDFFGGDKQETMAHYEAILSDADDYGLMVIFHGCTIPRGWEKMYPNYVGSEAVRASENLVFSQYECDQEAQATCLHPFIRNAVGSMEFGGCFMNERLSRNNQRGPIRRTTDVFELATAVLFQNPIQNFALAPNNLEDAPEVCLDFLREVPTTWDETRYIAGRPGESVVLARRNGDTWYVAAVNALEAPVEIKVKDVVGKLGLEGSEVRLISGGNEPTDKVVKMNQKISVPQNDGAVMIIE